MTGLNKTRGIVFSCSDGRWLYETLVAGRSCRAQMPDVRRQLFVTDAVYRSETTAIRDVFDEVHRLGAMRHLHRPRFEAIFATDLGEAIFIDSDTFFVAPVHELFDLLTDFDIAVSLAPQYFGRETLARGIYDLLPRVSAAQPEWNTGVIVARVDNDFRALVRRWSELFEQCRAAGTELDQSSFRSALAKSRLRIATLPSNYNFRIHLATYIAQEVKILHGHGDLPKIAAYINHTTGDRMYLPRAEHIPGYVAPSARPPDRKP